MLIAKGMRQPQARKLSPDIWLKASTARFARNKPQGTPNCGHDAISPRLLSLRAHSIDISTEPPHSPPTPTPWMKRSTVRITAPEARIGRPPGQGRGGNSNKEQGGDQRLLAPDAVAIMAEDRSAHRARDEA